MRLSSLRTLATVAIIASAAGSWPMCAAAQQAPKMGGTLRYGTVTEVASLDPHVYVGSAWKVLIEAIYSPLVGYDAKGKIVSRLAERWETPDAKTTVFHLRKGVTFHDGTPFSAEDVKFSLDRIMDQKTGATLRTNLAGVTVSVVDANTVKLATAEPNATLLSILALPEAAIVSKKWIEGGPNVKVQANGTGPFVLKAYEPSVRALLEKNTKYFIKGQPYLNAVEFKMIKSDDARVNALRTNAVDMIDFVPWKDIDTLRRVANLTVDSSGGAFMNLWFNATRKPYDDVRVRKAFAYAIDRAAISKAAFFGHGTPIEGPPTTSDSPYYNKDLAKTYKYDPARAKALLAEAGYAKGFEFEFLVFQGLGIYTSTAQIVQANLKDVGINAKIQLVEFADLLDRKNKANYDVMIYGVSMKLTDPDVYAYYLGADSTYWAKPIGYRDDTLEKLLVDGRATIDLNARKAIYRKVEQRVMETSPWAFVNFREQAQAYTKKVRGYSHLGGALNESSAGISLPTMWIQ
ncbi:MAG: twin-arginine translocation pathway signal [Alphaproteobacteria bacterium]|nr:twin-arginine translocation pathway signal [Alphaproteobacteria bacterium]